MFDSYNITEYRLFLQPDWNSSLAWKWKTTKISQFFKLVAVSASWKIFLNTNLLSSLSTKVGKKSSLLWPLLKTLEIISNKKWISKLSGITNFAFTSVNFDIFWLPGKTVLIVITGNELRKLKLLLFNKDSNYSKLNSLLLKMKDLLADQNIYITVKLFYFEYRINSFTLCRKLSFYFQQNCFFICNSFTLYRKQCWCCDDKLDYQFDCC